MSSDQQLSIRALGSTGLQVTSLCLGTSPLASMKGIYGYEVSADRAIETVECAIGSAINFIDTSNGYGEDGAAERRIGAAIAAVGLPDNMVLATKVDPDPLSGNFSGDRVRASVEESLDRLGIDHIQLLHFHDPERMPFEEAIAAGGPVDALVALRDEGLVSHLGVAGGPPELLQRYLDLEIFEVVLTHNRYTLVDRSAYDLFQTAHAAGIGTLNAAPYGGGMLAQGPALRPTYAYGLRADRIALAAAQMATLCERAGVPLAAAALQFSMRASFIDSTVVGVSSPERLQDTLRLAQMEIPDSLWGQLEECVPRRGFALDEKSS